MYKCYFFYVAFPNFRKRCWETQKYLQKIPIVKYFPFDNNIIISLHKLCRWNFWYIGFIRSIEKLPNFQSAIGYNLIYDKIKSFNTQFINIYIINTISTTTTKITVHWPPKTITMIRLFFRAIDKISICTLRFYFIFFLRKWQRFT